MIKILCPVFKNEHKFLGQFLLCRKTHIVSEYFEILEDVVVGYFAQTDTDTLFRNLFCHLVVLYFDLCIFQSSKLKQWF